MIERALFHNYRISESIQFISYTLKAFVRQAVKPAGMPEKIKALEETFTGLQSTYSSEQGSKLTTVIQQLDGRRDDSEMCFKLIVKGYQHHADETKKAAADILYRAIEKFGDSISRMNYQAETATLNRLVSDLETVDVLKQAVDVLGLQDVVAEIKKANELFETTYMTRLQQNAVHTNKSANELKHETGVAYNELIKILEAHMLILGEDQFATLKAEINELVNTYNTLVEERKSSGEEDLETIKEVLNDEQQED